MNRLKFIINDFIDKQIYELQEDGNLALDYCESQNNYHILSYWISGTYDEVGNFLKDNYSDDLFTEIISMYPHDLDLLKQKLIKYYNNCDTKIIAYEALASILLKELQHYPTWYTVYGVEEKDMIDFNKYSIHTALSDNEEFPIIKSEDVVAAMYGINDMVQPSDMYDIFAHYSDKLRKEKVVEPTFTPDIFLAAGVVARYKNYVDISKKKFSDYAVKFLELSSIDDDLIRNHAILEYVIYDYLNRYNEAPYGLPLNPNMIEGKVSSENKFSLTYKIRGIKNKETYWDTISECFYNIPTCGDDLQNLIVNIAIDFKRELNGLEKVRNKDIKAIEGKYPNKLSSSHGLCFASDINVHYKDKRGNDFKKTMKTNYSLAMAEKQALYLVKKSLRYANANPIVSSSFGIDSITALHLLKRVTNNYTIVFNNSLVEYPELIKFKRILCNEWGLNKKLIETKPIETYWNLAQKNGWNFERKGDRRNGKSNSEECCNKIKHIPMYNLIDKLINDGNPMLVNYTGLRASESRAREQAVKRDNLVYYSKAWKTIRVNPIAPFSNEMVWEYQKKHNLPYCEVYDKVLYYEDVYENIDDNEYHKVFYEPRIGCWSCLIRSSKYIFFLKKYYPRQYNYMMINKGLAKDLFIPGAKKLGIISDNIIITNNTNSNAQLSLFDVSDEENKNLINDITAEEILERYSLEDMEALIIKRPCKFLA